MRAWRVTALSMAVMIATALILRMFAGPPRVGGTDSLHARETPLPPPVALAYVMDHPSVAKRLLPLLDRNMAMVDAAQGFTDPIMFAAVVHAADNLNVPFLLLKQRVLAGGTSLLDAIRAVKPNVNAGTEAQRAYDQARRSVNPEP
jgi:hypothetical protein